MVWRMERAVLDRIIAGLDRSIPVRYLDFACGTGRVLSHVQSRVDEAVGLDVSADMLEVARGSVTGAELVLGDITRGDVLADRRFELITAFRFFPNAQPELRRDAIQALSNRMSHSGRLVFNNHLNSGSILRRSAALAGRRGGSHSMSHAEVEGLVDGAGLAIVSVHGIAYIPVSERRLQWVVPFIYPLEAGLAAMNLSGIRMLAQDIVYVCRPAV
jgi:predicted TPR repeat methyltransferase